MKTAIFLSDKQLEILAVEDLGDYSISDKDKSCELCGSNKDTFLAIVRYATRETPQEDEIMCLKCLGREGWKKIKGLSGYSIMKENKEDNK